MTDINEKDFEKIETEDRRRERNKRQHSFYS